MEFLRRKIKLKKHTHIRYDEQEHTGADVFSAVLYSLQ